MATDSAVGECLCPKHVDRHEQQLNVERPCRPTAVKDLVALVSCVVRIHEQSLQQQQNEGNESNVVVLAIPTRDGRSRERKAINWE